MKKVKILVSLSVFLSGRTQQTKPENKKTQSLDWIKMDKKICGARGQRSATAIPRLNVILELLYV